MNHVLGRFVGVLTAALFVAYLLALAPHLVHHLFDDDHGRPVCPYLAQSQQNPEIQADPPTLPQPSAIDAVQASFPRVSLSSPVLPLNRPRAPPCSAPSV